MSWSLAQSNTGTAANVGSYTIALGSNTPTGHYVAVGFSYASIAGTPTVTDSAGNSYAQLAGGTDPSGNKVAIFGAPATVAGALTVTIHFSAGNSAYSAGWVADFAHAGGVAVVAGTSTQGTSTAASLGPIAWPSGDNALLLGGAVLEAAAGTVTAGTGYTLGASLPQTPGTDYGFASAYRLNDPSGSSSPGLAFTTSVAWGMAGVALIEAPTTATLSPSATSGPAGQAATGTVTLDQPAGSGGVVVTPTVTGLTVSPFTIAAGSSSGTFTFTPPTAGSYAVAFSTSPALSYSGTPQTYTATGSYTLVGPASGPVGAASSNFTVTPADGQTIASDTVTLSDGGGGGTFTPTSLAWTNSAAAKTFTYTPASAGAKTITATSGAAYAISGSPATYAASTGPATSYTISGATSGYIGQASGPITVTPNGPVASDVVTITVAGALGAPSAATLTFANSSAPQSVTFTGSQIGAASLSFASRSLAVTNSPWVVTIGEAPITWTKFSLVENFVPGLATVGYTVYNPDGTVYQARKTAGVVAYGSSGAGATAYGASVTAPVGAAYPIRWDDGQSSPTYAWDVMAPNATVVNGQPVVGAFSLQNAVEVLN